MIIIDQTGGIIAQLNRLAFSILLIGNREQKPGWHQPPGRQAFYSLWLITKGEGDFVINGEHHTAEPGKLFLFTPGMICERKTDGDESLEYYFLKFSYASVYEEKDQWHFKQAEEVPFPLEGAYLIQNPPQVINLLEEIHHIWRRKGPMMLFRKKILFQELWLMIARDFRAQKVAGHPVMAIEMTIDYMVSHYKEDIRLEDLALMAGLSTSHYSRLFKKYVGYSSIDYLTRLRIDRAKELIALSDYKLKTVARSVGYRDEFYFSRVFKKVVGFSPSEYGRKHKAHPTTFPGG